MAKYSTIPTSSSSSTMLFAIVALFSCVAISVVRSQVAFEIRPYEDGAPRDGCYLAEYGNKRLGFGEEWSVPDQCMSVHCSETSSMPNGKAAFELYYAGCGVIGSMEPCQVVSDRSKPWPECCPKLRCPSENEVDTKYIRS